MKHKLLLNGLLLFTAATVQAQVSRLSGKTNVAYHDAYQRMAAGTNHYLEIKNGVLYASGANTDGQLGNGTTQAQHAAIAIGSAQNWATLTAGTNFSLGIKADGTLWAWGKNNLGQLGLGNTTTVQVPTQIGSDRWLSVSAGSDFVLAIKDNGTLWAWGANNSGQLGNGTTVATTAPVQVGTANNWIKIGTGQSHSVALKADGTLWSWGANTVGQIGNGTTTMATTPVQIGTSTTWKNFAVGGAFTAAIRANGTLWLWGDNTYGQISGATATYETAPVQIGTAFWSKVAAGKNHVLALKANGKVWSWGDEQGNGTTTNNIPVQKNLSGIVQIVAGNGFSMALKSNGLLYSWGKNDTGQLGNGTTATALSPLSMGSRAEEIISVATAHGFNSAALYSNGRVKVWGANAGFQMAAAEPANVSVPTDVMAASNNNIAIATGYEHIIVLKDNGTIWRWGKEGNSSNGPHEVPVQIGTSDEWTSVATGTFNSAGIKADGTLWTWGDNANGMLGHGNYDNNYEPQQVGTDTNWAAVAMGAGHTIALKADGTLWIWGRNYYDAANGSIEQENLSEPKQVGTANNWVSVNVALSTSLALQADGTLWGWGVANQGQLSGETPLPTRIVNPKKISDQHYIQARLANWSGVGLRSDGRLMGWSNFNMVFGDLGMGNNNNYLTPTLVPGQENIVQITSGQAHRSALNAQRATICMVGRNGNGELGVGFLDPMVMNSYQCELAAFQFEAEPATAESIAVTTFDNVAAVVNVGATLQLQALILPASVNQDVVWSVIGGNDLATINNSGIVTGVAPGMVQIRATAVVDNMIYGEIEVEVKEVVASNENFTKETIAIYPNPTTDVINLSSEGIITNIELYDLTGKRVAQFTKTTFDISHLNAGVYQTKIQFENGQHAFVKIIKK